MKTIRRIIVAPFVYGIIAMCYNYHAIRRTMLFIKHGGEWINYDNDKATIEQIYLELKEQRK